MRETQITNWGAILAATLLAGACGTDKSSADLQELTALANRRCPVLHDLGPTYHGSLMQLEYATVIIFRSRKNLVPLYEAITRSAIHAVKADQVATFLGRKLTANVTAELGGDFSTRIQSTRIRHHMGAASIKMYDKFGLILRIETTTNV